MKILAFDTETDGLPNFRLPPDHPSQPHLVQLAALLVDEGGVERASLSVIIEPDGYEIPDAAAAIHGITNDLAKRVGVPLSAALWPFICLRSQADMLVAHNIGFDEMIIAASTARMPKRNYHPGPGKRFCTMDSAAPIVNLPPTERMLAAGFNKPKSPKLEECIRHFFGEELAGAHDALVDVRACLRVFFHLQQLGAAASAEATA